MRVAIQAIILALILVSGLSVAPTRAQDFSFPERVGGAAKEFRKGTDAHDLGYYVRYWEAGARYDVFVYDSGFAPAPVGPAKELGVVMQALRLMKRIGSVKSFQKIREETIASKLGRFACMTLVIDRGAGNREDSLACVTSMNGFYVKLRASGPVKTGVVGRARTFLTSIAAAM